MKHNRLLLILLSILLLVVSACDVTDAWEEPIFFTSVNASTLNGTQLTATTANVSTLNVGNQTLIQDSNQVKIGSEWVYIPRDTDIFLYREFTGNQLYYSVNGTSGQIYESGSNATGIIQNALKKLHVNTKVRAGGNGGWYLDTLNISGTKYDEIGNVNGTPRGLQEVILDFTSIEFVKTGSVNQDFITIDSISVSRIFFGVVTGNVSSPYAMIRVTPTLGTAYSNEITFRNNTIEIDSVSGSGNGTGVILDSRNTASGGAIYGNRIHINQLLYGTSSTVGIQMTVSGGAPIFSQYANTIIIDRLVVKPLGTGLLLSGGAIVDNRFVIGLEEASGAWGINSAFADRNIYELIVVNSDTNEAVNFGATSTNNLVIGNYLLASNGWTNAGTGNIFIAPGLGATGSANITNGNNSVTVTHGLVSTPTWVGPTSSHNETGWLIWSANATSINITSSYNVTANRLIYWRATIGAGN